jgi:AAA+ ATPase superfamily predicted ATPase
MEEIRTPERYMDLLSAIAAGKNRLSEISDTVGLNRENATGYLKSLEMLGLIERITPVTAPEAKRGLYRMRDPFFSFWFRFVRPNKRQLELGLEENVWQSILEEFNRYLGQVFEVVAEEAVVEMTKRNLLPVIIDRIGRWWQKDIEIDLLALQSKSGKAIAIETKWSRLDEQNAKRVLNDLARKVDKIPELREPILGIVAKQVHNKEEIRKEGFMALDLQDIRRLAEPSVLQSQKM